MYAEAIRFELHIQYQVCAKAEVCNDVVYGLKYMQFTITYYLLPVCARGRVVVPGSGGGRGPR